MLRNEAAVRRRARQRIGKCSSPAALLLLLLTACTTAYQPPVPVHGSSTFPGLIDVVAEANGRPLDVIVVHGMCTHDVAWANKAIDGLINAMDRNLTREAPETTFKSLTAEPIEVVERTAHTPAGTIHFSAPVWSPLTTPLKRQLAYDATGTPTDCSAPGDCRPTRARLNGKLKDKLLNDCLADAMIYQGDSRDGIRSAMVETIASVLQKSTARARAAGVAPGPFVVVSSSLGSKLAFDALEALVLGADGTEASRAMGRESINRLAVLFMQANQLPILGLADQQAIQARDALEGASEIDQNDSLQRILRLHAQKPPAIRSDNSQPVLSLVAFTDPNDLLSYRLQPSRYAVPGIAIADVLVSNAPTYLGLLARPDTAHTAYDSNPAVATLISCGLPKSKRCR